VEDWETGLKVLYISPLKALINDQFQRISELSEYLDIPITRWHGEVSQAQKRKLSINQKVFC
jgi:ATP-dependent Lhr-like helicase